MYEVELFNELTNPPNWWQKFAKPYTPFKEEHWEEILLEENIINFRMEDRHPYRRIATFRNKGDYLLMVIKWS